MRAAAGPYLNHLERVVTAPTMTPAADVLFPASYLYDRRGSRRATFGTRTTDSRIDVDLNMLYGGDGEAADSAAGWTVSLGTLTRDAAVKATGAASLNLTAAGAALAYRDIQVRAGETLRLQSFNLYGGGGAAAAALMVQNADTNRFLQPDGTWAAGTVAVATQAAAAWANFPALTFQVESVYACGNPRPTLRIYLSLGAAGTARFDDIALWPATDCAVVYGHNLPPRLVPTLYSSPTGAFGGEETLEATMTVARPGPLVAVLPARSVGRFWRLKLVGTPSGVHALPGVGEFILAQLAALTRAPQLGTQREARELQSRFEDGAGGLTASLRGGAELERLSMAWLLAGETELAQLRDQLFRASRGGAYQVLLCDSSPLGTGWAFWGRLRDTLPQTLQDISPEGTVWLVSVDADPEPVPLV